MIMPIRAKLFGVSSLRRIFCRGVCQQHLLDVRRDAEPGEATRERPPQIVQRPRRDLGALVELQVLNPLNGVTLPRARNR
jgi:hypothetical protein